MTGDWEQTLEVVILMKHHPRNKPSSLATAQVFALKLWQQAESVTTAIVLLGEGTLREQGTWQWGQSSAGKPGCAIGVEQKFCMSQEGRARGHGVWGWFADFLIKQLRKGDMVRDKIEENPSKAPWPALPKIAQQKGLD